MKQNYVAWGRVKNCMRELTAYGNARKVQIGADKVFDFSLGSPSAPVPEPVWEAMRQTLTAPDAHEKTPPEGLPALRAAIAEDLNRRYAMGLNTEEIQIVTGAAGGLAVCCQTLLQPGDEAIVPVPYFTEYRVFIEGAGGVTVEVPPCPDMQPDLDALAAALTEKTRFVLVNTPNNPTGAILSAASLKRLADILRLAEARYGHPVYLVSDEPYRELVYDTDSIPCVMNAYENTILCYSFSKSLSLPGERIGYLAVSPRAADHDALIAALRETALRLGYRAAPAMMQRALAGCVGMTADLSIYKENRDLLYNMLTSLGYDCIYPEGAFYLFVKAPIKDAKAFSDAAKKYELLLVPSDDFGIRGYLRLAYCVPTDTIRRAEPAFRALAAEYGLEAKPC